MEECFFSGVIYGDVVGRDEAVVQFAEDSCA